MSFVALGTSRKVTGGKAVIFASGIFWRVSLTGERRRREGGRERFRSGERLRPRIGEEGCAWSAEAALSAARLAKYSIFGNQTRYVSVFLSTFFSFIRCCLAGGVLGVFTHWAADWILNRVCSVERRSAKSTAPTVLSPREQGRIPPGGQTGERVIGDGGRNVFRRFQVK